MEVPLHSDTSSQVHSNGRMSPFGYGKEIIIDSLSFQIFIEVKLASVQFPDFSPRSLKDDLRCCQVVVGNISKKSGFGTAAGYVAKVCPGTT
jgi:hypothetical protein